MAKPQPTWQRARRPEQREQRRLAILEAASRLLDEGGLEGTGLNAIARTAGMAKANVYRYFESREAVLLELLLQETDAWARALGKRLRRLAGSGDTDAVARAFADTIDKRERLCVLLGALAAVLEHNVGRDTVIRFKRDLLDVVTPPASALGAALPAFSDREAFTALEMLVMAAAGAWPHCHPAPVVEEVLALPEFAVFRLDFKRTMREHAAALLRGFTQD